MSWQFFVSHYQNQTQAQRDRAFTYRLENGTLYYGLEPPEGATPYVPRYLTHRDRVQCVLTCVQPGNLLPPRRDCGRLGYCKRHECHHAARPALELAG
jgi:hypothetical protein